MKPIPKGAGPLVPFNDLTRRRLERSERVRRVLIRRERLDREIGRETVDGTR